MEPTNQEADQSTLPQRDEDEGEFDSDLDFMFEVDDYLGRGPKKEVINFVHLMEAFPIDFGGRKNMPSKKLRHSNSVKEKLQEDPNGNRKLETMTKIVLTVVDRVAKLIQPGNPSFIFQSLSTKLGAKYETRMDPQQIKFNERAMLSLFSFCQELPRHTMMHRVSRADLVESGSQKSPESCFEDLQPPHFGRADFQPYLLRPRRSYKKRRPCARVPNQLIGDAVCDILCHGNVGILSWGLVDLQILGRTNTFVPFPKLTRKRSMEEMFQNYQQRRRFQAIAESPMLTRGVMQQVEMVRLLENNY